MKHRTNRPSAVGFGNCLLAYAARVPSILAAGEKGIIESMRQYSGGVTADALVQLAALGVHASWIGLMGADARGDELLGTLNQLGVGTASAVRRLGTTSGYCWILVDHQGERTGYCDLGITDRVTSEDVETCFAAAIEGAEYLLVEVSQFPLASVLKAVEIARNTGGQVILDFDSAPAAGSQTGESERALASIIEMSHAISGSFGALKDYTGLDSPSDICLDLLERGPQVAAVTMGNGGSLIRDADEEHYVPAYAVDVVDTTGAGDAYHGAFAYGFIHGMDPREIAVLANACGALCCTSPVCQVGTKLESAQILIQRGRAQTRKAK